MNCKVLTALVVSLGLVAAAFATQLTVTVQSFSFTPPNVTILPTDTVRWTHANLAGLHNVHHNATPSLFGNAISGAAWTYSVRFDSLPADTVPPIGTYPYVCQNHPDLMMGNVFVRSIWVSDPSAGATWTLGTTQTITWSSGSLTGNVQVELNRNYPGGSWETLFASTPDDGSEPWVVNGSVTSNARIRVSSLSFPSISDVSCCDLIIAVPPPSVTVQGPNGGETWYVGETKLVVWSSANVTGNVTVELNRDFANGATWEDLFGPTANDGFEAWGVAGQVTPSARIRVTSIDLPFASDTSDADFAIAAFGAPTQLTIVPSGTDLVLRWQPVNGATGYTVYRSLISSDSGFDFLASTSSTTLSDPGASASHVKSFYEVIAFRSVPLNNQEVPARD